MVTPWTVVWAFAAALGWIVAVLALYLAFAYRRDWSALWQAAWMLRREGFQPTGPAPAPAEAAVLGQWRRRPEPASAPPEDEPAVLAETPDLRLSNRMMELIMRESEQWRQEELATAARDMMREGASESEVVNALHRMVSE